MDIAVWGLDPKDTFGAIGVIMDLETEVPVNLVDVGTAFRFNPERVQHLVDLMQPVLEQAQTELLAFVSFLERVGGDQ